MYSRLLKFRILARCEQRLTAWWLMEKKEDEEDGDGWHLRHRNRIYRRDRRIEGIEETKG